MCFLPADICHRPGTHVQHDGAVASGPRPCARRPVRVAAAERRAGHRPEPRRVLRQVVAVDGRPPDRAPSQSAEHRAGQRTGSERVLAGVRELPAEAHARAAAQPVQGVPYARPRRLRVTARRPLSARPVLRRQDDRPAVRGRLQARDARSGHVRRQAAKVLHQVHVRRQDTGHGARVQRHRRQSTLQVQLSVQKKQNLIV